MRFSLLAFSLATTLTPAALLAQEAPSTPAAPSSPPASPSPPPPDTAPAIAAPAPASLATTATPAPPTPGAGFSFGSYGRVVVASDLRGRSGSNTNIVAHGSRLDLAPYAELQFNYGANFGDIRTRTVVTLAFDNALFHFTGRFDSVLAIRNLYFEETGALARDLTLWAGSRMYRGDDVYLLNFWPLDNLNTVGGGARYEPGTHLSLQAHVGMNRLEDPYQLQRIQVAPREGFGSVSAMLLDRPRIITSAKATYFLNGRTAREGLKLSLYGEFHTMGAGVRQTDDFGARELLPADSGYVVGAQVGGYTGVRSTFVNLFVRYAHGLGAYGDLRVPVIGGTVRTTERASEVLAALSGNYERGAFGVLVGAYVRYFRDADSGVFSRGALVEGAVSVRPTVWFGNHAGLSVEASYQHVAYEALDPTTGNGAVQGTVMRVGVVPFVSPAGRGNFTRPHLQLIYNATVRDDGARRLYAPDDPLGFNAVEHFLGVGTEWWFNSSYL